MNSLMKDYMELTKPRILTLVLVTAALGFYSAGGRLNQFPTLLGLLIGAAGVCAGSAALNHYLERHYDSLMRRTQNRPVPQGRISGPRAFQFGILLILGGLVVLFTMTNLLTAFLGLLTAFLYVLVYTPMKRHSWLNTTIGAIPGALPPLGGWAAVQGSLEWPAFILFFVMFIWQHPHFYAIAWLCRDDYGRAGFKMLPNVDPSGRSTFRHILIYAWLLLLFSLIPLGFGMSGWIYAAGAFAAGSLVLRDGYRLRRSHSRNDARQLLKSTVYYLPALLFFMILDLRIL